MHPQLSDPIRLDVGGVFYSTTLTTLTRYPDSMLGRMFGGDLPLKHGADGAVFIDRDGHLFRHVLNFLRSDQLSLPKRFPELEALKIEADFYQIAALIRALGRLEWKEPISLNVGGVVFSASTEALSKYPESYLGCVCRGVIRADLDSEGRIFIDRDGLLFRHVINFLRTDRLALPDDFRELESLQEEADFYQIPPLIKALKDYLSESNRFVEIFERSDCDFIMVHAPEEILNDPNLPFNPSMSPAFSHGQRTEAEREEAFYRHRGFCRFAGATKFDFCEFLRSIGCEYLDRSLAMTTVEGATVTKLLEKWSIARRSFH